MDLSDLISEDVAEGIILPHQFDHVRHKLLFICTAP